MSIGLLEEWTQRGLVINSTASGLGDAFARTPLTGYIGFDPTAPSLHVGSLLPATMLMRLQRAGHRPIAIVGGGTGLIGDPAGKEIERPMQLRETIEKNAVGLRRQLEGFLDFSGARGALLINNADWLCELKLIDFLRDYGKHFSVNTMIQLDSVKRRIEEREHGMSFTEFSYSLLQAYDFLELYDRHRCTLQLGGNDQWANILAGADLIRRHREVVVHGLTMPLLTRSDGKKFGKSEKGNIWLDPALTSPFEFYQYWLNTPDADVIRLLKLFTFASMAEIAVIEEDFRKDPSTRRAQRELAAIMTRMVHGEAGCAQVEKLSSVLFTDEDLSELDPSDLRSALASSPSSTLNRADLSAGVAPVDLLVQTGLADSKTRARETVLSGAFSVNHRRIDRPDQLVTAAQLIGGSFMVLRRGKKTYHLINVQD